MSAFFNSLVFSINKWWQSRKPLYSLDLSQDRFYKAVGEEREAEGVVQDQGVKTSLIKWMIDIAQREKNHS